MTKERAFYRQKVRLVLARLAVDLEEEFQKEKQALREEKKLEFVKICRSAVQAQTVQKMEAGYLLFFFQRTRLQRHDFNYSVMLYGEQGYLGEEVPLGDMDFSLFWLPYEHGLEELKEEGKKYQITACEVEQILMKFQCIFHDYVVEFLHYGITYWLNIVEYETIRKAEHFSIQCGEYMEPCEILHQEEKGKDVSQLRKWLGKEKKDVYCHGDFRGIDLMDCRYAGIDLYYADFRDSFLRGSSFTDCRLVGTRFDRSQMEGVEIVQSILPNASFDDAEMRNAKLRYCMVYSGVNDADPDRLTGYFGTSFVRTDLRGADFTGSRLNGIDFRSAYLEGATFSGTRLEGSKFTERQLLGLGLTKAQMKQIERG